MQNQSSALIFNNYILQNPCLKYIHEDMSYLKVICLFSIYVLNMFDGDDNKDEDGVDECVYGKMCLNKRF